MATISKHTCRNRAERSVKIIHSRADRPSRPFGPEQQARATAAATTAYDPQHSQKKSKEWIRPDEMPADFKNHDQGQHDRGGSPHQKTVE